MLKYLLTAAFAGALAQASPALAAEEDDSSRRVPYYGYVQPHPGEDWDGRDGRDGRDRQHWDGDRDDDWGDRQHWRRTWRPWPFFSWPGYGWGRPWYGNDRCDNRYGRRLTDRQVYWLLQRNGYQRFWDLENHDDGYRVRAIGPDGRRVRLFIDGACGRIRHWR